VNDQVVTTCASVAGKYGDVLALERSMEELHQMFLDLALLTEHQGEHLDRIEFQVQQAGDETGKGNQNLCKSIEFQKKIRKKQAWLIVIVVVVVAIVVVSIIIMA